MRAGQRRPTALVAIVVVLLALSSGLAAGSSLDGAPCAADGDCASGLCRTACCKLGVASSCGTCGIGGWCNKCTPPSSVSRHGCDIRCTFDSDCHAEDWCDEHPGNGGWYCTSFDVLGPDAYDDDGEWWSVAMIAIIAGAVMVTCFGTSLWWRQQQR